MKMFKVITRLLSQSRHMKRAIVKQIQHFQTPKTTKIAVPQSLLLMNAVYGIITEDDITQRRATELLVEFEQSYNQILLKLSIEGEEKLVEFMNFLISCVVETSKEYRAILKKQKEILERCNNAFNNTDEEQLQKYKNRANELKEELLKYKEIINNAGDMAYHQAVSSFLAGSNTAKQLVCREYSSLEKLAGYQFLMNETLENQICA